MRLPDKKEFPHAQVTIKVIAFVAGLHSVEDPCIHHPIWRRKESDVFMLLSCRQAATLIDALKHN